ncbi:MAG TPA: LLM class flavin-dependent oxidoreductase [Solirubrobacteraceae bacterium]|nr:LLM class flavin-dependent oxidoreductase [Solirubrobacteraceae bacterium]
MRLGAYFIPLRYGEFIDSVKAAERAGYARAWVCDSPMIWQDPYVYMAGGLAATERIVFGTAVTNPVTRHYATTASAHATLESIHPGRVVLGIGRGDSAIRTLGLQPARVAEMRRVVPALRELTAGRALDQQASALGERVTRGEPIRITWARHGVPIMIGGTGPRTMRLAGALADEVTLEVGAGIDAVRWAIGHVRAGAEEAGRPPGDVKIIVLCGMWLSDDLHDAREHCRWAPASAANHVAEVAHNNPGNDMPVALTRILDLRAAALPPVATATAAGGRVASVPTMDGSYDYYTGHCINEADHARWIPDEVIDEFALAGPAEMLLARIRELEALGVSEVAAAFLGGELAQMRAVGEQLIARL